MFGTGSSAKGQKMSFIFRFGVTLIALLTVHVVFTIYRQLGEASQVFREIAQGGIKTFNVRNTFTAKSEHIVAHSPSLTSNKSKNNNDNNARELDRKGSRRSKSDGDESSGYQTTNARYTKQFQSHFQENVYTIERRIFESDQTRRAGQYFHEMKRNVQSKDSSSCDYPQNFKVSCISHANVLILAYHRSGSSFLGEFFNRNRKIFYLFEPIQPFEAVAGHGKYPLLYDTLVRHLLGVIYRCSFHKHPFFVRFLSSSVFRLKSQILTSSNLCNLDATSQKMHLCQPLNATFLTNLCFSSSHTVVKTIRASNRKILRYIAESKPKERALLSSLKVIHLVRDPRAIISSRLTIEQRNFSQIWLDSTTRHTLTRFVRVASANLCSRVYSDIKHGKKILLYSRIRYEDAAMQPLKAYEEIYKFAGINQSLEVRNWLEKNTKSDRDPGYYSTSRNSSASVHGWRSRFPLSLVLEIQNQCSQLMKILGYALVQNEKHLKDTSKTLVVPSANGILFRQNPFSRDKFR